MNTVGIFKILGLDEEYAKIYTSLMNSGKMRVVDIAKATGLPRTSCYEYLPKLLEMGFVDEIMEGKSRLFQAKSPQALMTALYKFKNDLNFSINTFEEGFAELIEKYNAGLSSFETLIRTGLSDLEKLLEAFSKFKNLKVIGASSKIEELPVSLAREIKRIQKKSKFIDIDDLDIANGKNKTKNILKIISDDKMLIINLESRSSIVISEEEFITLERHVFEHLDYRF